MKDVGTWLPIVVFLAAILGNAVNNFMTSRSNAKKLLEHEKKFIAFATANEKKFSEFTEVTDKIADRLGAMFGSFDKAIDGLNIKFDMFQKNLDYINAALGKMRDNAMRIDYLDKEVVDFKTILNTHDAFFRSITGDISKIHESLASIKALLDGPKK